MMQARVGAIQPVNDLTKNILVFIVIIVVLLSVVQGLNGVNGAQPERQDYSQFLRSVRSGDVNRVVFKGERIDYGSRAPLAYYTISPETDNNTLIGLLEDNNVNFTADDPESPSLIGQLLISSFPILLLIGVWIYFMRQMQGGGSGRGAMSFGKSKARLLGEDQVGVTFADVAGVEEAKQEVAEIVDFLRDPSKFQRLGGKIPKGVLMVGPPGTGKTLLAKAIAGEAKVPFFTISGSDFVEMFVGVGASRVRDMFDQAKKQAPCIIFIDELDAVGRHRGAGLGGGHDEREQTLNQMLVEMDGFEGSEGIIVIAATNRPDVLDPALAATGSLRPSGRRAAAGYSRPRADSQSTHAQSAARRQRECFRDCARHARFLGRRSRKPRERGGAVRRTCEQARRRHGRIRTGERQDHDGHRAPLDGDEREGEAQHGLS